MITLAIWKSVFEGFGLKYKKIKNAYLFIKYFRENINVT